MTESSFRGLLIFMTGLEFDNTFVTLKHGLWRWLWWSPDETPRGGDVLAGRRTRVRWEDIVALDATGPFPELVIRYHTDDGVHAVQARPKGNDRHAWVDRVNQLFHFAALRDSDCVRAGWTAADDIIWMPLDRWPDEQRDVVFASPYRGASHTDPVRAIREAPPAQEVLMHWLSSSPDRPWQEFPRRVVVTEENVCIERRDRRRVRVARHHLRGRRRTDNGDRAYYYGRSLQLMLPLRDDPCPVVWALDADYRRLVGPD